MQNYSSVLRINPFKPEFIIFIHYKPRIAAAILVLQWMKMTWCGLKIKENYHVLVNQFHWNFRSKTLSCRKIKYVFRDVKWCCNASWGLKGLMPLDECLLAMETQLLSGLDKSKFRVFYLRDCLACLLQSPPSPATRIISGVFSTNPCPLWLTALTSYPAKIGSQSHRDLTGDWEACCADLSKASCWPVDNSVFSCCHDNAFLSWKIVAVFQALNYRLINRGKNWCLPDRQTDRHTRSTTVC